VDGKPVVVVAVLFPDVTQLDLTGPAEVFAKTPGIDFHVAAAGSEPVPTDCGFTIGADVTFVDSPAADVLMVPGGRGVDHAMGDPDLIRFVRGQARSARWVTSVCTGSLPLVRRAASARRAANWDPAGLEELIPEERRQDNGEADTAFPDKR
jgi:cyclohexyl-isocyanide hydratase